MGACFVLLCSSSVRITGLLDMEIYLQLIIKSPGQTDPDFKAKIVKPNVRLIMIENKKSKADIYVRSYREQFGLCNYDSLFFLVCCLLQCYHVCIFYVIRTILGLTFLHPDTIVKRFLIPIHTHIRDTYYARVGCCKGAMLTPGFFPFFSID